MTNHRGAASIGLAGLAALAVAVVAMRSCSTPDVAAPIANTDRSAERSAAPATTQPANEPSRETANAPPPAPSSEPWLDHPYELAIDFLVVDAANIPRLGVTPFLAPADLPLNPVDANTSIDGHAVVRWRSRSPQTDLVTCDDQGVLRVVSVGHGVVRTFATTGAASPAGTIERTGRGLHPFATFVDDSAITVGAASVICATSAPSHEYATKMNRRRAPVRAVETFVFGEDGRPAPRQTVMLSSPTGERSGAMVTDDTGRALFRDPKPGTYTVHAGGDGAGLGTATATVTDGTTKVRIDLHRGTTLRGRLVRTDGESTWGHRVLFVADDGSCCDETWIGSDGTFALANLSTPKGHLFAFASRKDVLPVAFALHTLAGDGETVLTHDSSRDRRIRFDVALPDECAEARVEVRVWGLDHGLGAVVPTPKASERWTTAPLAPGAYRVELRAPGCGHVDLGRQWLDGSADLDLGRIVMPHPGRVRFVIPVDDSGAPFELYEVRRDVDVRVPLGTLPAVRPDVTGTPPAATPLDHEVLLPAGDYALACRRDGGEVEFVQFTVRSGERVDVSMR